MLECNGYRFTSNHENRKDKQSQGQDSNSKHPRYESGVLTNRSPSFVCRPTYRPMGWMI